MTIRQKLFLGGSLIAALVLIGVVAFLSQQALALIENNELAEMERLGATILAKIEEQMAAAEDLTLSVAENPEVQRVFALRDRRALEELLLPGYQKIAHRYAQMQFHLPDSTSFLRLHKPEEYGDSLKDFRFTVNEANRAQQTVRGLEEGRGGYGIRVVVPVFFEGRHLGSVEYGGDFGLSFLESLREEMGGNYYLHQLQATGVAWDDLAQDQGGLLVGTAQSNHRSLDPALEKQIEEGSSLQLLQGGEQVLLLPLRDFQGDISGFLRAVYDRSGTLAVISRTKRIGYTLGVASALILALLLSVLQGRLLRPLARLVTAAQTIGEGDFTVEIAAKSEDEVGQVGKALNYMRDKVVEVIKELRAASESILGSSQELSAASEENAAAIEEVAGTTNQFASNVVRLNATAAELSREAEMIKKQSDQSSLEIQEAVESSARLNRRISSLAAKIEALGRDSEEISHVVDVITQIAEQTNLLALNAAIEAARAGEQGRGFAVVAAEVRSLAEQSARAGQEITGLITNIQNQTAVTVREMDKGAQEAEQSSELTKAGGKMVQEIMGQIEGMLAQIQALAQETEKIDRGSEQISAITEEQSASVEEVASAAGGLTGIAEHLQGLMAWFKV
ncbi:MAG: methyl-accepting chemotaxis protein [Firmicutes bacterium]|nr:methyl-accepting chemotaxis protein [Bacillota bacterium]